MSESDISYDKENKVLSTPFPANQSSFGQGNQVCIDKLNISVVNGQGTAPGRSKVTGHANTTGDVIVKLNGEDITNEGTGNKELPFFSLQFGKVFDAGDNVTVRTGNSVLTQTIKAKVND